MALWCKAALRDVATMKIFCDLDDVLALYECSASAALGVAAKQLSSSVRWDLLSKKRLFFETLPWTKGT